MEIRKDRTRFLLKLLGGSLLLSLIYIFNPILDVLVFCLIFWLPLFIWRQKKAIRELGLLRGLILRVSLVVAILTAVVFAPGFKQDAAPIPESKTPLKKFIAA